ncbi:hypothetical protein Tco_1581482, partial [Tanacetum coccineum]
METKDTLSSCSNSEEQQMQEIQDKAKISFMVSFRQLYSYLKLLSNNDLKGTELSVDSNEHLRHSLVKITRDTVSDVHQVMDQMYMDDEYVVMTRNYFLQYTQLEIPEFCDTLIQHMESVKKSIDERAKHKREYDRWVNERQILKTKGKVDTCKALDASLVDTKSSVTELKEQDTSSISGNDAHTDDADIRPIYDEEPMA